MLLEHRLDKIRRLAGDVQGIRTIPDGGAERRFA